MPSHAHSLARTALLFLTLAPVLGACEGPPADGEDAIDSSGAALVTASAITGWAPLSHDVTMKGDWKIYGTSFPTNVIFASGITSQIKPLALLGGAVKKTFTGPSTFPKIKWTNGVPISSGSTTQGLQVTEVNQAFQVTVPAGKALSELRLYTFARNANIEYWCQNNDGTGFAHGILPFGALGVQVVACRYRAASDNQTMTFTWMLAQKNQPDAVAGLMAVQYGPYVPPTPYLTYTPHVTPPLYRIGTILTLVASATDDVPDFAHIQIFRDGAPLAVVSGGKGSVLTTVLAGKHAYSAQVTSSQGAKSAISAPFGIYGQ